MSPAHCTSWDTYCFEISSTLAWGRKVPSVRGVPPEGCTRVLSVERLCTSREDLRTLVPFRPRAIWRRKARARSRRYTLHYSTCSTRRITQACVFTPHHTTVFSYYITIYSFAAYVRYFTSPGIAIFRKTQTMPIRYANYLYNNRELFGSSSLPSAVLRS